MRTVIDSPQTSQQPTIPEKKVGLQMAYLLSGYPAFSLTFVLDEILGLRRQGFDIVTASINPCDQVGEAADDRVREEEANTFYVKRSGVSGTLGALFRALLLHPAGMLRGLLFTFRLGGTPKRFFYFLEALIVGAWMRRQRRTHLHTHFGGSVASVAMITSKIFPISLSLSLHGPDEFWDVTASYLREKVEAASFVCCISSYGRSQLMMLCPPSSWEKLIVSRLGVDLSRFSPVYRLFHPGPVEIVCVGRLVGAKGQHILIAAFEQLIRRGRDVRLRLVGKGPQRADLESAVASLGLNAHVVFEGAASVARVREILEGADIFALPSFAEGIPVALMEAMAMEIPCVSTTVAGIPELITSERDGLLVAPSDVDRLAEALLRLVDDPDLRKRFGMAGRLRVQAEYDLGKSLQRLGEIFQCRL